MDRVIGFLFFFVVLAQEMLALQCSAAQWDGPLPLARFSRLWFHYINGKFSEKTHHEEVDVA
jgi:hypothetical protein